MEEGHHRDGGVYAFDLVIRSTQVNEWRTIMNTYEFGCLSKVVIPYCGRNELPGLLRLCGIRKASGDKCVPGNCE